MRILKSRLLATRTREARGGGERPAGQRSATSASVRRFAPTCMHPYQMVKDHRTGVEVGNVQGVLDGGLDRFVEAELRRKAGAAED